MGRGQIVSGGEFGMYQVKLIYAYRNRINARLDGYAQQIALLDQKITAIDAQIAAEADPVKKAKLQDSRSVMVLQRASVQKLHDYYSTKMPADPTVAAWCADATEDLAAGTNVGTIEIPGEPSTVLVRPAYNSRSVYTAGRDGNLMPSVAGSPYQVLFNWMLLPGWQRHKPIYRAGTIVPDSLDFDLNTCSVCLDPAYSSQQSLPAVDGLAVGDCNMGDDDQSEYLTSSAEDFCSRNPGHPFCTQSPGSEINITDAQLAQLRNINLLVNGAYGRANDPSGISVGDKWDVMGPGGSGDCEDFVLTKMQMLVDTYGWNPNNLCMVTAFAKNGEYHAMLGVRTRNRGLVVLDVNYDEVMESGRVPYRIDKVALASDDWRNYARRLDSVPIEYMTCNAGAFADGDRVVVEFTSQKWTQPKVIGFIEQPQPCQFDMVMVFGNATTSSISWGVKEYRTAADDWDYWYNIPGDIAKVYDSDTNSYEPSPHGQIWRTNIYSSEDGGGVYLFGGLNDQASTALISSTNPPYFTAKVYDRSDKMSLISYAWSILQNLPGRRHGGQGVRLAAKHFVIGGTDYIHDYGDASRTKWIGPWHAWVPTGHNYFTTNFEYSTESDAWAYRQDCDEGRQTERFFVLNAKAYRLKNRGPNLEIDETDPEPPPRALDATVYRYSAASNSWDAVQSQLRAKDAHGAGTIGSKGYIGHCSVGPGSQQLGDTIVYEDLEVYGYRSSWIERYSDTTDTWEYWMQDMNRFSGAPDSLGQSSMIAGKQGMSIGYVYDSVWVAVDTTAEIITAGAPMPVSAERYDQLSYQAAF